MNQSYPAPDEPLPGDNEYQPALFQASGRLGRMRYFVYFTAVTVVVCGFFSLLMLVLNIASAALGGLPGTVMVISGLVGTVASLFIMVMGVLFGVRRLNDINASGWLILLMLVPVANLVMTIVLLFVPGSKGVNRYGPPAMPNSPGLRIALYTLILMLLGWAGLFGGVYVTTFDTTLGQGAPVLHSFQDTAQGQRL